MSELSNCKLEGYSADLIFDESWDVGIDDETVRTMVKILDKNVYPSMFTNEDIVNSSRQCGKTLTMDSLNKIWKSMDKLDTTYSDITYVPPVEFRNPFNTLYSRTNFSQLYGQQISYPSTTVLSHLIDDTSIVEQPDNIPIPTVSSKVPKVPNINALIQDERAIEL